MASFMMILAISFIFGAESVMAMAIYALKNHSNLRGTVPRKIRWVWWGSRCTWDDALRQGVAEQGRAEHGPFPK